MLVGSGELGDVARDPSPDRLDLPKQFLPKQGDGVFDAWGNFCEHLTRDQSFSFQIP